jgi:hypothetical protein
MTEKNERTKFFSKDLTAKLEDLKNKTFNQSLSNEEIITLDIAKTLIDVFNISIEKRKFPHSLLSSYIFSIQLPMGRYSTTVNSTMMLSA